MPGPYEPSRIHDQQSDAEDPLRASRLQSLASRYHDKYQRSGNLSELQRCIELHRKAMDLTSTHEPAYLCSLELLGHRYWDRYVRLGAEEDLEQSMTLCQKVFDDTPLGDPQRVVRLSNLGNSYGDRYQAKGDLSDLERSIQLCEEAVNTTLPGDTNRPLRLFNLAVGYNERYEKRENRTDMDRSIDLLREAVDISPTDAKQRPHMLQALGAGLCGKYLLLGAMDDIQRSINLTQEALDMTPLKHFERAHRLHSLSMGYRARYRTLGAMVDLEQNIKLDHEAIECTISDRPGLAAHKQSLGSGYVDMYDRTGNMANLDKAIYLHQEAIELTSPCDALLSTRMHQLGVALGYRYERLSASADVARAIELFKDAVEMAPLDDLSRVVFIDSLAVQYGQKFRKTRIIGDQNQSIEYAKEALNAAPVENRPNRARRLQNLGVAYGDRFGLAGGPVTDQEQCIQCFQEAIDLTPPDDPMLPLRLQSLGSAYFLRQQTTGNINDLERSLELFQRAVDIVPPSHRLRPTLLEYLGIWYETKYESTKESIPYREKAIQIFQEISEETLAPADTRVLAGAHLIKLYSKAEEWMQAQEAASRTMSVFPLVTPQSLNNVDKQNMLVDFSNLASDAAAVALNAGKAPVDVIQILELGRGLIATSLNHLRSDISELEKQHPDIAADFNHLREELDAPLQSATQPIMRYETAQKLELKINEIRSLPEFSHFLQAQSAVELAGAADYGPVVIINESEYRCDALIIQKKQFHALKLPDLTVAEIQNRIKDGLAALSTLEWLWNNIAHSVLSVLGISEAPSNGNWPHVYWVLTGNLAKFPIHAAGIHREKSNNAVIDRVISTYSTTVQAIVQGRQWRPSTPKAPLKPTKVVLVGMENTPGQTNLPHVTKEIEKLERLSRLNNLKVDQPKPLHKDVLASLKDCDIFHFAGHGYTDPSNPSQSGLLLRDWAKEPLMVSNLLEINLRQQAPFLAYLSACGTGQNKNEDLMNENLHLIGAYQLAGFQHVIGTLWEVNDESCADIAYKTHEYMQGHGITHSSVSEALHHAIRSLRDKWILENFQVGPLACRKRAQSVRRGRSAKRRLVNSGETRDPRDIFIDEEPSQPIWVPYIHFGY